MTILWYDWAGYAGVLLVLGAFFLLQSRKLHGNGLAYQLMNALGAFGVMLSLLFGEHNWPAFMLEVAWVAISVYGIANEVRRRRLGRQP